MNDVPLKSKSLIILSRWLYQILRVQKREKNRGEGKNRKHLLTVTIHDYQEQEYMNNA